MAQETLSAHAFREEVASLSVAPDWDAAVREWRPIGCEAMDGRCRACGHRIKRDWSVRNERTGAVLRHLGSECVRAFGFDPLDKAAERTAVARSEHRRPASHLAEARDMAEGDGRPCDLSLVSPGLAWELSDARLAPADQSRALADACLGLPADPALADSALSALARALSMPYAEFRPLAAEAQGARRLREEREREERGRAALGAAEAMAVRQESRRTAVQRAAADARERSCERWRQASASAQGRARAAARALAEGLPAEAGQADMADAVFVMGATMATGGEPFDEARRHWTAVRRLTADEADRLGKSCACGNAERRDVWSLWRTEAPYSQLTACERCLPLLGDALPVADLARLDAVDACRKVTGR